MVSANSDHRKPGNCHFPLPARSDLLAAAVLFCATLLLFSPALRCDFLDCDDTNYVTQNLHVRDGLTAAGAGWAFRSIDAANWHPLTWLSHMLDWQLYGPQAVGHHATSLLLHAANAALVFLLFRRLTGAFWTSALCAALFAWHPLRVESVAWVAERKDVLSAFFFLLTLLAYSGYVARLKTAPEVSSPGRSRWYCLSLGLFICGLLSKPMLVTLPCVMLLLDYWPLGRFQSRTFGRLLYEKAPFFLLSAGSCMITYYAQSEGGSDGRGVRSE